MTDTKTLIEEARAAVAGHAPTEPEVLAYRLADALEAAEREVQRQREINRRAERQTQDAEEEAAALAAVVEKVRERAERIRHDYAALPRHEADDVDRGMSLAAGIILRDVEATTPTDALREHDAQVRAEEREKAARIKERESEQADREPSAEAPTVTLAARSAGKTNALIEEILTKADDGGLRIEIVTPDREPTDAEVEAAARAMYRQTTQLSMSGARGLARAALIAAREVNRG